MELLLVIVIWLVLCILVSVYASNKGLDSAGYFLLALLLSPVIGFIAVAVSKPSEKDVLQSGKIKKCPYCAELVKAQASVCRFCGRELETSAASAPAPALLPSKAPHSSGSHWLPVFFVVLGVAAIIALPNLLPSRMGKNEQAAIRSLRTLSTAAMVYQAMCGHYPESFSILGPSAQPSCTAADLVDSVLATGEKSGYRFEYTPRRSRRSRVVGFAVLALPLRPGQSGTRGFFLDESGVIRQSSDGSKPTENSPPI